jgi:hypothetical protein
MSKKIDMVECGCCGRVHTDRPGDCRGFLTCAKCGDAYWLGVDRLDPEFSEHAKVCDGNPSQDYLTLDEQMETES